MKRPLLALVLAVAAAGAALAGTGLVVAPHVDPPGTPSAHDHVLAAYRYPLFLMRLQDRAYKGERASLDQAAGGASAAVVLALLALAVPRLPRPARTVVARFPVRPLGPAEWRHAPPLAPPRAGLLRSVQA